MRTGRSELQMQMGDGIADANRVGIGDQIEGRETGKGKRETGNGKRETGNGKRELGNGNLYTGNEETRKRGNKERSEAEGNTARDGDKAPNLTNE